MGYNVAIDGPAGAGKSTIAKRVAKEKGYNPAKVIDEEKCVGCASCALMCPDVVITVERD